MRVVELAPRASHPPWPGATRPRLNTGWNSLSARYDYTGRRWGSIGGIGVAIEAEARDPAVCPFG